ncbi:MAG: class I SAM-dependent methyltransferase [Anaerolineales bacterium]|nr:MAG: class I SAM-dependent methyltransferase [Anaerolineales bacterium]
MPERPEVSQPDPFVSFYERFYGERHDDLQMYRDFALAADGSILELGCGTGRVLIPLALDGHNVTGLELSADMLARAQAKVDAAQLGDRVTLIQGDMRDFEIPSRFGLAFIPINTFMHCYDTQEQLACLRRIHGHLQPGGQLVVDVYHPDPQALLESDGRLVSQGTMLHPETGNTVHRFYTRRLDLATQTQHITFIVDEIDSTGRVQRALFPLRMRFVYRYEMALLLRVAGFSLEAVYGSYDLEPFDSSSDKMIFVARVD